MKVTESIHFPCGVIVKRTISTLFAQLELGTIGITECPIHGKDCYKKVQEYNNGN